MPSGISCLESPVAAHGLEQFPMDQQTTSTSDNAHPRQVISTRRDTSATGQSYGVNGVDLQSILFLIDASQNETRASTTAGELAYDDVDDMTSEADSGFVSSLELADSCFSSDEDEDVDDDKQNDSASVSNSSSCHDFAATGSGIPRRKRVSFADENGLDLEKVQVYEPVNRSQEWYNTDIYTKENSDYVAQIQPWWRVASFSRYGNGRAIHVEQHFPAPWSNPPSLISRLQHRSVALETITSTIHELTLSDEPFPCLRGTILVVDLAYDKRVYVRCTFDGWRTYRNVPTSYVGRGPIRLPFSHQQPYPTDLFTFDLVAPCESESTSRCDVNKSAASVALGTVAAATEFAICYEVRFGDRWQAMWDNNDGKNYRLSYIRR